jgi:transcriptional regulator of acetoin/glycerol metabolism
MVRLIGYPDVDISQEAMHLLRVYSWPGNIRELWNVLERALILSGGGRVLTMEHFLGLDAFCNTHLPDVKEKLQIESTLKRFNGDVKKAAEALGISRATLYRKLKKAKSEDEKV